MTTPTDFKKEFTALYAPSRRDFSIVDVPRMHFLLIDGEGNPNTAEDYRDAVDALYAVSYALKFASKQQLKRDYVVAPLEGLWSSDDPLSFQSGAKDQWRWTMTIMQPEWITNDLVVAAIEKTRRKKDSPALRLLRYEPFAEGRAVQILHVGSYDDEAPTLRRLHEQFMPEHGLTFNGRHHEIYLSDARRTQPEKLKTILRQPVKSR